MRVAGWAYVLCAVLVAVAIFLPCLDLRAGGSSVSKRTERSLHQISADRALIHRMLVAYHGSAKRKLGTKIIHAVTPRASGRPRAALEDARDAMDTLDADTLPLAAIAALIAAVVLVARRPAPPTVRSRAR